jgi:glucose-1-phosphate thymidylyltransferase long form
MLASLMNAVVLAAGEGVRLRPLTITRPKHLIPVGGKPLLEHILLAIKSAGLNEAVIVVHYMAERIKEHFGDGSKLGLKLEYVFQPEIRGTADAIILAEPYVSNHFLMLYGDLYVTTKVVKAVLKAHKNKGNPAAMAVVPVQHTEHYGIIRLDGSRVTDIIEKPKPGEAPTNLANAGVYVLPTQIFEKIKQTLPSLRGEYEITDSLRFLSQDQPLVAVQVSPEEWLDVGRPWDLLEANKRVLTKIKLKASCGPCGGERRSAGTFRCIH